MKVTRQIKAAINRRANEVARGYVGAFVQEMTALIEGGVLQPDDLGAWWPDELETSSSPADGCAASAPWGSDPMDLF